MQSRASAGGKRREIMTYEEIVEYVQKKLTKIDAAKAGDLAVQVDVTGDGEGAFYIAVKDGKIAVEPYEYYDHDAKIVADSSDIIAMADGKLDAGQAFNEGKIRVEGNVEKFLALKEVLPKAAKKAAPAKKAVPAKKAETAKKAEPAKKAAPAKKAEPAKKEEAKKEAEKPAEPAKKAPAKKAAAKKK